MNKRIRELAEKAELYARSDNSSMLFENYQKRYKEKFAELIVQECLEVVERQFGGGDGDGVEWDRAVEFTYDEMKQHFGVE